MTKTADGLELQEFAAPKFMVTVYAPVTDPEQEAAVTRLIEMAGQAQDAEHAYELAAMEVKDLRGELAALQACFNDLTDAVNQVVMPIAELGLKDTNIAMKLPKLIKMINSEEGLGGAIDRLVAVYGKAAALREERGRNEDA